MNSKSTNNESPAALLASINAQRIEAECFNWLCAHPNWRFIEQLCLRVTAEDTTGFKAQLIAEITKRWGMNEFHRVCDETMASTAPAASESRGSVPDGFVLVPRDPNRAMQDAGMDAARLWFGEEIARSGITRSSAIGFFKAMLAAAPTPPAVASGEPTSVHWMMAFAEQYDRIGDADCMTDFNDLERRARELARSAAAKGEG